MEAAQHLGNIPCRNGVYRLVRQEIHPRCEMPSHVDVAKQIFDDAKKHTSQHQDSAQWDLLNGLSELCLAVESLQAEVGELKSQIKKLQ
jgi:hypothetical protein